MIGYDTGGSSGGTGGWTDLETVWDTVTDLWDDIVDTVQFVASAIWEWVETIVEIVRWVRVVVMEIYGVPMERWQTHADERTCPQCASRNGAIFEQGTGEAPPLHTNCRCQRVFAYTDWRTRPVVTWQRQVEQIITGSWHITGWA